jgi:hypothetical protein
MAKKSSIELSWQDRCASDALGIGGEGAITSKFWGNPGDRAARVELGN